MFGDNGSRAICQSRIYSNDFSATVFCEKFMFVEYVFTGLKFVELLDKDKVVRMLESVSADLNLAHLLSD